MREIKIVEADANNLRDVSVQFPRRSVTAIVGVSGSGKTSLLQHTLAAQGHRRNEVFLGLPSLKDTAERSQAFINELSPVVHLGQRGFRPSVRTTVGTSTGILGLVRRLFLALGRPVAAGKEVPAPSAATYSEWLRNHHKGIVRIWAVPAYFEKTDGKRQFATLVEAGIEAAIVRTETDSSKQFAKGRRVSTLKPPLLGANARHVIEAQVGEYVSPSGNAAVLNDFERAFHAGRKRIIVELPGCAIPELQSEFGPRMISDFHWVDPASNQVYSPPSDSLLTFNSPAQQGSGACRQCLGTGRARTLIVSRLVTHPERPMHRGALSLWTAKNYRYVNIQHETIEGLRGLAGFDPDVPWNRLSESARRVVLDGWAEPVADMEIGKRRRMSAPRHYEGFIAAILDRVTRGAKVSPELEKLVDEGPCPSCEGSRWSTPARALRVGELSLEYLLGLPLTELANVASGDSTWRRKLPNVASAVLEALHRQGSAFVDVGLGHLSAARGMLDVSEGESRRSRLAAILDMQDEGLTLLLDEPARGLHEVDIASMATAISELAKMHTVVLNEHRGALVQASDWIIEMGPGAGKDGGMVSYSGVAKGLARRTSETSRSQLPVGRAVPKIAIEGASLHSLNSVDCEIPVGRMTSVVGLSGSGKSNFVRGILVPAVVQSLGIRLADEDFSVRSGGVWKRIACPKEIKAIVALDHRAPSQNRRSLVGTYLGVFDDIRKLFSASPDARKLKLGAADFGLNGGQGRCMTCLGTGEVRDGTTWIVCPACGGARYGEAVLSVQLHESNIASVLATPVSQIDAGFLPAHQSLFAAMGDLGIGYIALGRRVDTLSGGEAQRLRIAQRLAQRGGEGDLFVLDEPAAGLHPSDVARLLDALDRIVHEGRNTVVLIEHNLELIGNSDWVIEFGPGTGPDGGQIVFSGTPSSLKKSKTPTGQAIAGAYGKAKPHSASAVRSKAGGGDVSALGTERVVNSMRRLRGEDLAPAAREPGSSADCPAVVFDAAKWHERKLIEVAGLDMELLGLVLEVFSDRSVEQVDDMAAKWLKSGGSLAIHPFVPEMRTWGSNLPASVRRRAVDRIRSAGLKIDDTDPQGPGLRATGDRFAHRPSNIGAAKRDIGEALAIGGGYVELRTEGGRLTASASDRPLDLQKGVVGPAGGTAESYSRRHQAGACPVCAGAGRVSVVPDKFVIRSKAANPMDEGFLTPEALELVRGIRRTDLVPLIQGLAREGLWPARKASFNTLTPEQQVIVLHGCWTRPGHGTFLRPKKDPSEVGAWIRWNGLYAAILQDLSRSKHGAWRQAIETSSERTRCPSCEGTGLRPYASLLRIGSESWQWWMHKGTFAGICEALVEFPEERQRQRLRRERLVSCLKVLAQGKEAHRLGELATEVKAKLLLRTAAKSFTDMSCVEP